VPAVRAARFAAGLAALAAALWLLAGRGLVNYDTLYSLVWGRELAQGRTPDLEVPLAPTPHPLGTLLGLLAAPLSLASDQGVHGEAAQTATLVIAFVALAALGWVVFALGRAWFDPWVGVLAALIVLTRRPVLDFGARAYIDIPYVALVLGALLVETRRPRAGVPVLVLLALAGLIRPEAWLFAGAYWLYLLWRGERDVGRLALLAALAAAGPLLWALSDWLIAGSPVHSLTGTRDTARELGRITGLDDVPLTVPRRIGEILREPVLVGAVGGLVLSLAWLRSRVTLAIAAAVLALAAFCVLAAAGLPILGRYLLLPAAIGAILCGAGAFGWRSLPEGDRRRRPWAWFGLVTLVLLLAFTPAQVSRLTSLRDALATQDRIQDDLRAFVREPPGRLRAGCAPIGVPNHRPVPLLALWVKLPPERVVSLQGGRTLALGSYAQPATPRVAKDYVLDPRDRSQAIPPPPAGFGLTGANRSWRIWQRCAPTARFEREAE
jgi:hypothetical protein